MPSISKARKIVENTSLPEADSLYISNFLVNNSIKAFVNEFHSRVVPFSYVEMFFKALKKSQAVNNNKILSAFFSDKSTTPSTYCYIYFLTYKQITSAVIEDKKYGLAFVLKKVQEPQNLSLFDNETPQLFDALEILEEQMYAFSHQSANYTRKAFSQYLVGNPNFISIASEDAESDNSNDLIGKEVFLPQTKGKKIYHLYIPTLPLPTKYPTKTSRVHSTYFAKEFSRPTTAVDFLSNYGIVQVKYNQSFIELRGDAAEQKSNKKINWSDFF